MKKVVIFVLLAVMLCGSMLSCTKKTDEETLGIGFIAKIDDTKTTADVTVAAVVLDGAKKIQSCSIDVMQLKPQVSAEGKITVPESYRTKEQLGDEYGMQGASPIDKEWYEQADSFCSFIVGRTSEQVESLLNPSTGKADDADLLASCSITISAFVGAVKKACDNADVSTGSGDTLKLGIVASDTGSADAAASADGRYSALVTASALVVSGEKVTACAIDAVGVNITFNALGASTVSSDALSPKTKRELGTDYGMKDDSPINKEWYEQADAFSDFILNRTLSQITGLGDGKGGAPTDEALLAGCTISVTDFCRAVSTAMQM